MRRRLADQQFEGGPWDGRHFEQWEPCEREFEVPGGRYVLVDEGPSTEPVAQVAARYRWTPDERRER